MRTLLIAAAAALSAMPSSRADACGGYVREPQVLVVSTHHLPRAEGGARRRMFVILDERAPEGLAWTRLAPGSYDDAKIASAPPLAEPMEVTLVGPSGTRTVKLRERVYLASSWQWRQPTAALEVEPAPGEELELALRGAAHAAWLPLDGAVGSARDVAWLGQQDIDVRSADATFVQRIRGTGLELVTAYPEGAPALTIVRRGERAVASHAGTPAGAYADRGGIWLASRTEDGRVRTMYAGAALRP